MNEEITTLLLVLGDNHLQSVEDFVVYLGGELCSRKEKKCGNVWGISVFPLGLFYCAE